METETLEVYLGRHPLFRDLDPGYVKVLAACARTVHFAEKELIFRQGESADGCYLIRDGNVALQIPSPQREPLTIQTLGAGEVLGWSWLFPPYKWHYDARAVEQTGAVALKGSSLRESFDQDPRFGYELMMRFSTIIHQRMQAARMQILDLYGPMTA